MAATRTTFKKTATSDNQDSPKPSGEIPPPQVPMAVARWFVAQHCMHAGTLTLRHWRGGWWQWRKSHWSELEERAVRSLVYTFTEHAFYLMEEKPTPWAPTRRKIGDLLEALAVRLLAGMARQKAMDRDVLYHGTRFAELIQKTGVLFYSDPGDPKVSFTRSPEVAAYWALLERDDDEGR